MLEEHMAMLDEAKKRDHRKIGKELELFTIMELSLIHISSDERQKELP